MIDLKLILVLLLGFTHHRVHGVCRVQQCANSTTCVLSKDLRSCSCAAGFYGDQCDKNAHVKVLCDRNYIGVRAVEDYFKYHNVPLEALHLPNKSCSVHRVLFGGVPFYVSTISKEEYLTCGGKPLLKNITHISYSLSLRSEPQVSGNIVRNPVVKMDFTCTYPYIRRVSLPFPVFPFSSETVVRVDELDATIQLMLYTDQSYTTAYSDAPTIELRDKVYVEVAVTKPADFFLLRINECWATQFPQPNVTEGSSHTLLLNGCAKDQTLSFLNVSAGQSGRNGESSTIRYSFDMFRFTTEPHHLYLHCSVQLCEPDESCAPNCHSISKREAVRAEQIQGLLSYGPIMIDVPDRPPSGVLVAVVLPVAAVWIAGVFLMVLITVAKAGSRRLGRTEEH